MKVYHLILFLLLQLTFSCCKEDDNKNITPKDDLTQLPPETQEGKNTFGCLVNGQVWRNQGRGPTVTGSNLHAGYYASSRTFYVEAIKGIDSFMETLSIQINGGFRGKGIYNLDTDVFDSETRAVVFISSNGQKTCEYKTDSINTGILEITRFDSIHPYIVSGRFSFTVVTPGCDTVRVTDGRFDIRRN